MNPVLENLKNIENKIQNIAKNCGRAHEKITLMPVSKTVKAPIIQEVIDAGYPLIGENKIQEIQEKAPKLKNTKIHLIGHLQSNKIKYAVDLVECIQSLDSFKLAEKLQNRLEFKDKTLDILIQINSAYDKQKYGVLPENLFKLLEQLKPLDRLKIKGFMTIGAQSDDKQQIRNSFKRIKELQKIAQEKYNTLSDFATLSMGMSHDMDIAIEEGATLLRIGSALFGARQYPNKL